MRLERQLLPLKWREAITLRITDKGFGDASYVVSWLVCCYQDINFVKIHQTAPLGFALLCVLHVI